MISNPNLGERGRGNKTSGKLKIVFENAILALNNCIKSDMVVSRHQALINKVVITKFKNKNAEMKKT